MVVEDNIIFKQVIHVALNDNLNDNAGQESLPVRSQNR